jgi:hypothetical protein
MAPPAGALARARDVDRAFVAHQRREARGQGRERQARGVELAAPALRAPVAGGAEARRAACGLAVAQAEAADRAGTRGGVHRHRAVEREAHLLADVEVEPIPGAVPAGLPEAAVGRGAQCELGGTRIDDEAMILGLAVERERGAVEPATEGGDLARAGAHP